MVFQVREINTGRQSNLGNLIQLELHNIKKNTFA